MADYALPDEKFVEIPGVVEIRWASDDPDTYVEPTDLFEEQARGLPDFYGKKDKATTEQAYFVCNLCECDLKSIKTLRDHCKGQKHVRRALQKKLEYRTRMKKEKQSSTSTMPVEGKTLVHQLESTSEAVVGLEFITEFTSGNQRDPPLYHCKIKECRDEQGNAETMKCHILSLRHKQSYLYTLTGCHLNHQAEIQQRVAEITSEYRRNYQEMRVKEDREAYRRIERGTYRYRVERSRSRSPRRRRPDKDENIDRERKRQGSRDRKYYEDRQRYRHRQGDRERESVKRRRSSEYDDQLKRERRIPTIERPADTPSSSSRSIEERIVAPISEKTPEEEDVRRFHSRVATAVMSVMNKYYPGSDDFDMRLYKIRSAEDYSRLAKQLSCDIREKIKTSYMAFNMNSLEGIIFTGDHHEYIKTEVDSFFENMPLVR